ncbi:MaoC family dehydratase N-terminal domain-containing protein [Qipengyuania sp. YG27]|uniref:MaoC family dehydratase N-terminal domain-containing protein n=1 Tax=Qipengyuania mesophila TaxID=2867246 RepID=A0ABS7JUT9_9SPHN|nr:MaoC family dehydratase N-terminal domain-containing protein [Qipengyuania mesophila]MBX7501427.1 MaoC family dehydratase N-terminal domain-containing protein [Qipengyuania mesophila]
MDDWSDWIGREQRAADRLDPALAARWCATFDRDAPSSAAMPQGIHLCLCTPEARTAQLGDDGHPARDDSAASFLPPVPLPRRMWASSAMRFHAPIAVGASIERVSRVASVEAKSGTRGDMVFVEVDHETSADGALAVSERQTLVYLEALAPDAPLSPPEPGEGSFDPSGWDAHREVRPDERLLFRYSALTFNTHRIHYDAPYAREVERYRGLVVHGPLTASLLLQVAAERFGENRLANFAFRGVSPAVAGEPLHLVLRGDSDSIELGAFAGNGRQVTKASATLV